MACSALTDEPLDLQIFVLSSHLFLPLAHSSMVCLAQHLDHNLGISQVGDSPSLSSLYPGRLCHQRYVPSGHSASILLTWLIATAESSLHEVLKKPSAFCHYVVVMTGLCESALRLSRAGYSFSGPPLSLGRGAPRLGRLPFSSISLFRKQFAP